MKIIVKIMWRSLREAALCIEPCLSRCKSICTVPAPNSYHYVESAVVCYCSSAMSVIIVGIQDWDCVDGRVSIFIDSYFRTQLSLHRTVRSCFAMLHELCSILRSFPSSVYRIMVVSNLHCGNTALAGILAALIDHLMSLTVRWSCSRNATMPP